MSARKRGRGPCGGVLEGAVLAALVIFALTYVAVAVGRVPGLSVDRPSAALLGAVVMVAAGVLSPSEAGRAVNGDTLGLLLGTMILSAYLGEAGFFRWASGRILRAVAGPRALLWAIVFTAGVLSAFLVNDTVCLMLTPLVIRVVDDADVPALPYFLALAFGANAGSVATLTGNPQNMIVGTLSGIPYLTFAAALALPALVALALVATVLHLIFRRDLPAGRLSPRPAADPGVDRRLLARALGATLLAIVGFLAGLPLSWTALLGAGAAHQAVTFSLFSVAGSQLVSNVPFVLLAGEWIPRLDEPRLLWLATALASTLAGNLTVLGSVANVIVLELAGSRARISFWRFLAIGSVVTATTLAAALAILLAERALGLLT